MTTSDEERARLEAGVRFLEALADPHSRFEGMRFFGKLTKISDIREVARRVLHHYPSTHELLRRWDRGA